MSAGHLLLRVDLRSVSYGAKPAVLRELRFEVAAGETVALIGQSGSGKSTLSLAILRLLDWTGGRAEGSILFAGGQEGSRDLLRLRERELREIRGREIALILQSAASALNPRLRIETQFQEAWRAHSAASWRSEGLRKATRLLEEVGLPSDAGFLRRYPREVSLGQAQRVLIAMSLLHDPKLLLADEPTSALDAITQREALELIRRLTSTRCMATLFISHDLLSVASLCERTMILHEGRIVEDAPTAAVFASPVHEYTRRLIGALPANPFAAAPRPDAGLQALAVATRREPEAHLPEASVTKAPETGVTIVR